MGLLLQNNKKMLVFILFISCWFSLSAQSFKKLSAPEKRWVFFHPIKAKKAAGVTKQVTHDVDSIKQTGFIGKDNNGGALDAFKHSYWMALLTLKIGSKQAKKIGDAHEKGNYLQFKKNKLEDAFLPDSVSSEMDLFNNSVGIHIFGNCKTIDKTTVQKKLLLALKEGKLKMIKKDGQGNFLNCEGEKIDLLIWKKTWGIPKCLVDSFY